MNLDAMRDRAFGTVTQQRQLGDDPGLAALLCRMPQHGFLGVYPSAAVS
jgi:hypothetical protein